jgi:hypothetical protein
MKIKNDLKDWQVAQEMFGKNTQWHCKLVKTLRKHGEFEELCEGWSIVKDKRLADDCGWVIPNTCIE